MSTSNISSSSRFSFANISDVNDLISKAEASVNADIERQYPSSDTPLSRETLENRLNYIKEQYIKAIIYYAQALHENAKAKYAHNDKLAQVTSEITERDQRIAALTQEIRETSTHYQTLQKKFTELEAALRQEIQILQHKDRSLLTNSSQLKTTSEELAKIKKLYSAEKGVRIAKEQALASKEQELIKVREENRNFLNIINKQKSEINSQKSKIAQINSELRSEQSQRATQKNELESVNKKTAALQRKIDDLLRTESQLHSRIQEATKRAHEREAVFSAKEENLFKTLNDAHESVVIYQENERVLQDEINTLRTSLTEQRDELAKLKASKNHES